MALAMNARSNLVTKTVEKYMYDAVGNRLGVGAVNHVYDSSNELLSKPNTTFTYDNNGNTLSKAATTTTILGTITIDTTSYAWDFENRLSGVTKPDGTLISFKYDPFGRRIEKNTHSYIYDGASILEEVNATGTISSRFVQGAGIDEPLAVQNNQGAFFYNADGLGSITSLSDPTGTVVETNEYDSFGKEVTHTGIVVHPYRYTAREWDGDIGLYYYRARYYEPQNGRFLSEDPFRFQAGLNFYRYVGDNPVNFIDPSGLKPCTVDVRCWPIEKFHLGSLGAKHCYVTVRNSNCELRDISGGPQSDGSVDRLHIWETAIQRHPEATTYTHDAVPCRMIECIVGVLPAINGLNLKYTPIGPNSNSAIATALSACGLADIIQRFPSGAVAATPLEGVEGVK